MMYLVFFMGLTTVWVAGHISPQAQAAQGMVTQCGIFLSVVVMALSSGATAAVSQSLGAMKVERARRYIATTVIGSIVLGIGMAVPGWLLGEPILRLLRLDPSLLPIADELWHVAMLGLPAQYAYSASGVTFRATRQVLPPLQVAALVCLFNLIASLGLGLGHFGLPDMGYMGLAWSHTASQYVGAICNTLLLRRAAYLDAAAIPGIRWLRRGLPYLLRVALPAAAAQIVWQSGYLTLFVLVASVPLDSVHALAGLTAGLRVEALLFMPGMAFNMTVAVLVGNSLGAGKPKEAKRISLALVAIASAIMSAGAMLIWPFRPEIAAFLSPDVGTQRQIVDYLDFNLVGTPFSIASQVMGGIMVGAGATRFNLMVYGGTFWIVRIPLGWLLGHLVWRTASGVFAAMLVSQCLQAMIMLYVVLYCDWPRYAMREENAKKEKKQ